jgi:hypothetical protein
MKKIALFLISTLFLISCGDKKKSETETKTDQVDKYSIIIDAVYEKNDSLLFIYGKDGALLFDKVKGINVKGSTLSQKIVFEFPEGEKIDNIGITMSFNKEQKNLVVKSVTIKNGEKTIISPADNYLTYFQAGDGFSWDAKNSMYVLDHTKKYPPSFMGSEQLKAILQK